MPVDDKTDKHAIVISNRNSVSISGANDVESFDESEMVIDTVMGILIIHGSELKINRFNVDTGELIIEGNVDEAVYQDESGYQKKGMFSKIFG